MKKQLATAVALALGIGIGSAQAATIGQLTSMYTQFMWEDDDIEGQGVDLNGNSLLDVGDTLRGIVEITAMYDTSAGVVQVADLEGLGRTDNHLAAVFETEVKSKTFNSAGADLIAGTADDLYEYQFGAVGGATGTVITFYESGVDNLTIFNCGTTFAACEGFVTDGSKILELGFVGDPDEFWFSSASPDNTDLGLLEFQGLSNNFGIFDIGLSVIFSSIGAYYEDQATTDILERDSDGNNMVQWSGGGTVKGACTENGTADADVICDQQIGTYGDHTATSDADVNAHRVVPEPASLALLGLGLLGMSALRRRS